MNRYLYMKMWVLKHQNTVWQMMKITYIISCVQESLLNKFVIFQYVSHSFKYKLFCLVI